MGGSGRGGVAEEAFSGNLVGEFFKDNFSRPDPCRVDFGREGSYLFSKTPTGPPTHRVPKPPQQQKRNS